jgi:integrase
VVAEPLEPQAVRAIVKRRATLAGLKGDFSAHSLRSGFMTEAGRRNVPLPEAMALTGHRSVATALRYFQTGAVEKSRAGNLLGWCQTTKSERRLENRYRVFPMSTEFVDET